MTISTKKCQARYVRRRLGEGVGLDDFVSDEETEDDEPW